MNRRQKIVQQQFLQNEEAVIKRLKQVYNQSNKDITGKIASLDSSISALQKALADVGEDGIGELAAAFLKNAGNLTPEEAKATLQSMLQSKVYQKQYQTALKKQVGDILDKMQSEEFKTVDEYLQKCYEEGFIGTMYDLQGQGIPMCFPMDQEAMVRAVQLDSKISQGLYSRLGEDVTMLKKKITAQVSRGIATGMTFHQVAQQLAGYTNIGFNNAVRIARTEGHRIQCQSGMDACHKAKEKGADVVKQWDATLDGKTRDSHAAVDGEIKELEEKFGNGLMFPGDPSGAAAEVINCRCALLQRARWAVGGSFTKMNNFTKQLETFESPEDYAEFKKAFFSKENKQYMNYVNSLEERYKTKDWTKIIDQMTEKEYDHYFKLLSKNPMYNGKAHLEKSGKSGKIEAEKSEAFVYLTDALKKNKVDYREVSLLDKALTGDEIISKLAGGDMTAGSCSSLGFAYIGNKNGFDVIDFRGGNSQKFFSQNSNIQRMIDLPNVKGSIVKVQKEAADTAKIIAGLEHDKEYYIATGRHAAIIRNTKNGAEYLELQSSRESGWTSFVNNRYGSTVATLQKRFGCRKTVDKMKIGSQSVIFEKPVVLIEVDSFKGNEEFKEILGYINTAADKQKKGVMGGVK